MDIKVSIIIPIYNNEKYLKRCIDSLINQSLKEIEIILINDGSTDDSRKICESYSTKDKRVRLINKLNRGVSDARNLGLEVAKGDCIGFVDSDDYVDQDMYKIMYEKLVSFNCDIVMCDFNRVKNNGEIVKVESKLKSGLYSSESILSLFIGNKLEHFSDIFYTASVVKCLYKKEVIGKTRFVPIKQLEDRQFNVEILIKTGMVYYFSEPFYYYLYNENSLSNNYNRNLIDLLIFSEKRLINLLQKNHLYKKFNEEVFTSKLKHCISIIKNEAKKLKFKNINKSINNIKKFRDRIEFNKLYFNKVINNASIRDRFILYLLKNNFIRTLLIFFKSKIIIKNILKRRF
jgi:glycosyltransferase involved in cell wall biosynthesis